MRVKRFVANDIQEAMARVKSELGSEAVILHTRHFKEGGILGLFCKNYVEITAAVDTSQQEIAKKLISSSFAWRQEEARMYPSAEDAISDDKLAIHQELHNMKKGLAEMPGIASEPNQPTLLPRLGQNLQSRLLKQGVDEKLVNRIIKATMQQLALNPPAGKEIINQTLYQNLLKPLKNRFKPVTFNRSRYRVPKVYALVGPTGVGKTTTIAKLAAMYALTELKKVSFVTVDTYRIAAVEQLKTIGDIMNVPVSVVYSLTQLEECLREISDSDVIFIDTAGRSHKNVLQMEELQKYLEIAKPDEVFLALSSTSKSEDLFNILEVYKDLNITRLIFTKLDETSYYGSIYNVACKTRYPLSYFTTGQSIPDDIEIADPTKLVHLLMKE